MPAITGTVLMNMGKQLLKNMAKKTVKATAKKAVKSVVKKKKVKGKDVAKKMFGGDERGGALAVIPKAEIVPSPSGDLIKPSETGGEIVKVSGTAAKELGLNNFMESLTKVRDSVNGIKSAINDNNKDTVDRIEAQRILNNDLKKKEREKNLESKKDGIGKKLLSPIKDPAEDFLTRMAKFAAMTLLGSLIAALMGGARDVILAFRIGIEALKKGLPTLLKAVKALQSGIAKSFKLILKPFTSLGKAIFEGFKTIGSKLFGWVSKSISNITKGIKNFGKNIVQAGSKALKPVTSFVGNTVTRGKDFVKNTASKAKGFAKNTARRAAVGAKRFIGRGARKFLKGGGKKVGSKILKHGMKRGANRLIIKFFGKEAAKTLMSVGKTLMKGAKAIKIPVIGPLLVAITSMFAGDPMDQTLFKTAGAAIGGGLGLALGPIGMIVGEIAGEFVGDVLYEGFRGKDGFKGAAKKLKDKFMQILDGGKKVGGWLLNSIKRIGLGGVGTLLNPFEGPRKKFTIIKDAFFPPADMAGSKPNTDGQDVSSSASYEDGGESTTVILNGGGGESSSPSSASSKNKTIVSQPSKQTVVNSQYEMVSNTVLYKV